MKIKITTKMLNGKGDDRRKTALIFSANIRSEPLFKKPSLSLFHVPTCYSTQTIFNTAKIVKVLCS